MGGSTMASDRLNRRDFIARAAMLGTGVVLANTGSVEAGKKQKARLSTPRAQKIGWRVACQLYTFRDRSFYEALDVISSLGIRYVEPCYFLSLDKSRPDLKTSESLSQDVRRELKKRLDNHGVKMINYYAPIDGNTENFRKIFDFGKEMGVQTLVAEPPAEVFDKLEELCD